MCTVVVGRDDAALLVCWPSMKLSRPLLSSRARQRLRRVLKSTAVLTVLGASGVLATNLVVLHAASEREYQSAAETPARHVAIVLGAKVQPSGVPSSPLWNRLRCGLDLYREGKVRKLLVSGDHGAPEYDEPNAMRDWLVERGVLLEDVFTDHAGFRTYDTMRRAREVFGVRDAVVCTQAFHMPRALFLARDSGIDAVGLVAKDGWRAANAYNTLRETFARSRAWADATLGVASHLGGPVIPITGDGRLSHDR